MLSLLCQTDPLRDLEYQLQLQLKLATTKKKKTTKQGAHGGDKQNQAKKKKSTKKVAVK